MRGDSPWEEFGVEITMREATDCPLSFSHPSEQRSGTVRTVFLAAPLSNS